MRTSWEAGRLGGWEAGKLGSWKWECGRRKKTWEAGKLEG